MNDHDNDKFVEKAIIFLNDQKNSTTLDKIIEDSESHLFTICKIENEEDRFGHYVEYKIVSIS